MKRLLKEPLLHFLVLGAVLFGIDYFRMQRMRVQDEAPAIIVHAGLVAALAEQWELQWQRPPSEEDLRSAVDQYVREEVLYREAIALGLDRDDTIIRRRLAQKMAFLFEDLANMDAPSEPALLAYFEQNIDRYLDTGRVTFTHVFFSRQRRGERIGSDAAAAKEGLSQGTLDAETVGDPFMLEADFRDKRLAEVGDLMGEGFARALEELPLNSWQGPVESAYGVHLVFLSQRSEPRPPMLAAVRDAVLRDYAQNRREEMNQALFDRFRERYRIDVDASAIRDRTSGVLESVTP